MNCTFEESLCPAKYRTKEAKGKMEPNGSRDKSVWEENFKENLMNSYREKGREIVSIKI